LIVFVYDLLLPICAHHNILARVELIQMELVRASHHAQAFRENRCFFGFKLSTGLLANRTGAGFS
jgi:hypothetical protein